MKKPLILRDKRCAVSPGMCVRVETGGSEAHSCLLVLVSTLMLSLELPSTFQNKVEVTDKNTHINTPGHTS